MAVTGHKIYWGFSSEIDESVTTVHPVNASYNSPIDVSTLPGFDAGNPTNVTLPTDFWDATFNSTGVYFRIAAYDGVTLVGMSKLQKIKNFVKSYTGLGRYFPFSLPLDDGNAHTVKEIENLIVSNAAFFKNNVGEWKFATPGGLDETPIMDGTRGVLYFKPDGAGDVSWLGKAWRKES